LEGRWSLAERDQEGLELFSLMAMLERKEKVRLWMLRIARRVEKPPRQKRKER
jgi:hypothetical protein